MDIWACELESRGDSLIRPTLLLLGPHEPTDVLIALRILSVDRIDYRLESRGEFLTRFGVLHGSRAMRELGSDCATPQPRLKYAIGLTA